MRKLKLQVQMTVDGFIAGTNGEMDWMVWNWDDELKLYVEDLTNSVDCIILGRKLAEGFIPHWSRVAANPKDPEFVAGRKFTDLHKVVFTKTIDNSPWDNTVLAKGELFDEIKKLKEKIGRDIIVYGGATFVSSLISHKLIDDFHLFVNPAVIGNGKAIFNQLDQKQNLKLINAKKFDCGIVVLNYEMKPTQQ